jgi:hypothetical protein
MPVSKLETFWINFTSEGKGGCLQEAILLKSKLVLLLILISALVALAFINDRDHSGASMDKETIQKTAVPTKPNLLLGVDDVKKAFEKEGFILELWLNKAYYKLNNVEASMFQVKDGRFAIYVYKSVEDRQKARIDFNDQTATAKVALSHIFEVQNLLVFELKKPKGSGFRVNEILAGLTDSPVLLSTSDVTSALAKEGVELQQTGILSRYFKLNRGIETGYQLDNKEQLYIYVLKSKDEVEVGLKQIEGQTALVDFIYSPVAYKIHNILIMYLKVQANPGLEMKIHRAINGE